MNTQMQNTPDYRRRIARIMVRSVMHACFHAVIAVLLAFTAARPADAAQLAQERPAVVLDQATAVVFTFNSDTQGNLWVNHAGAWSPLGKAQVPGLIGPIGGTPVHGPVATFVWGDNIHRICVFVTGDDGVLYDCFSANDGGSWTWESPGPIGKTVYYPTVISYWNSIAVFVSTANGEIWRAFWNSQGWQWLNTLGVLNSICKPTAVTLFNSGSGTQNTDLFAAANNLVYRSHWTAQPGLWFGGQLGPPPPAAIWALDATTYWDGSIQHYHLFANGADGGAECLYNNGAGWIWAPPRFPTGTFAIGEPSPVTYFDGVGQRFHVFTMGNNGNLYDDEYIAGQSWAWKNLSNPGTSVSFPAAITYSLGGTQYVEAIVHGSDGNLYRWQEGAFFPWFSLGHP